MNKRALMLSAATASLLAGQVLADTDITKQVTTPQTTSQDGNITIESDGSIVINTARRQGRPVTINSEMPGQQSGHDQL